MEYDTLDEFELAAILRHDMAKNIEHNCWPRLGAEVLDTYPPSEDPAGFNYFDVVLGDRVYRVSARDIGAAIR